ncbi:hypothetical protein FRC07_013546 [Ceratobasidium sp. 392]|nr:hypothetical protein FRC07_013546 [Ceratobasidium sp. 392]
MTWTLPHSFDHYGPSQEIIERVYVDFVFEVKPPTSSKDGSFPLRCVTPGWGDVAGFTSTSPELRGIGYIWWLVVITGGAISRRLKNACLRLSLSEVMAPDPKELRLASYMRSQSMFGTMTGIALDTATSLPLPTSLRRLDITNAHGPDIATKGIVK